MARRNRLTPFGELVAVPDRGTLCGNRGRLLDADGELARHHGTKGWVICRLEWKGWRRTQWQPGRLTELFLLDEPTGLAAGHRPCGLCRRAAHDAFKAAWARAHPGADASAPGIDAVLHEQRMTRHAGRGHRAGGARAAGPRDPAGPGWQRTHTVCGRGLPDGAMVAVDGAAWLVAGGRLRRWTPGGYAGDRPLPRGVVELLTPPATVAALRAGYVAVPHRSAR